MTKKIFSSALILGVVFSFVFSVNLAKAVHSTESNTAESSVTSITLSSTGEKDIAWTVNGYSSKGFKVVWSKDPYPTYPLGENDKYHYYSDPNKRADTLETFDGEGVYYARDCEYLGGKCGVYSNQIKVDLTDQSSEATTEKEVKSIKLYSEGEKKISWKVDGYSEKGFKVVWSKDSYPTYPLGENDKYHYYSDPNKRADTLETFDGEGVYYARVCEYLGGKCGVYSNQIKVVLTDQSSEATTEKEVKSIKLYSEGEKKISWKVDGYSEKGFKVVWSKDSYPTYPLGENDKYHYYSDPNKRADTLETFDGEGVYYARVCEYLGGKCGVYSNQIKVDLTDQSSEATTEKEVKSIKLYSEGEKKISWKVDGYSEKGFKVVWSKDSYPTYPLGENDKYHYYSDPNKRADTLETFDGEGVYYARVCEYLGGKCGVYSNQIKVDLTDQSSEAIKEIEEKAELLSENKLDDILSELKELRDVVQEQKNEIKYLQSLVSDLSALTS